MAKHSIQDVIEQIPQNKLEKASRSNHPLLAKQARLAETLAKLRKRKP